MNRKDRPVMLDESDLAAANGGGGDWFIADSFSFGVEREMKESPSADSFSFGVEREMKESGEK